MDSKNVYSFATPKSSKNGSYYVFKDAIFSELDMSDCNDSIFGVCKNVKNLDECMKYCENSDVCVSGYLIENDNEKICVPLKQYSQESEIPYYRMRNKNIYPQLQNATTTVFIDKKYPYPPNMANVMFYTDSFVLENVATGVRLGLNEQEGIDPMVTFSNENSLYVQAVPSQISRSNLEKYVPIKNEDEFVLSVPHTALILRKKLNESEMGWIMRATVTGVPNNKLTFHVPNKKRGELLNYSDTFYITFQGIPLAYDENTNKLVVSSSGIENTMSKNENLFFRAIPKIQVYYCDNGCQSVSLEETDRIGDNATYKGKQVYRSPSCWNACPVKSETVLLAVFGGFILFFLLAFFLVTFNRRKRFR